MNTETPIYEQLVTPYVLEEHDWDIQCEGSLHPTGDAGHVPNAPATYLSMCPRCSKALFKCSGWVLNVKANSDSIHCGGCERSCPVDVWHFIPLEVS